MIEGRPRPSDARSSGAVPAPPSETNPSVPVAAPTTEPADQRGERRGGEDNGLREVPLLIVVAAVIAFLLKTFIGQAFFIPSGSMIPQLEVNDRVVVSKLSYRLHEPRRGDLVVFDAPPQAAQPRPGGSPNPLVRFVRGIGETVGMVPPSSEEFIKRVIALGGETVEARDGMVYVNGLLLVEPYLPDGAPTADFGPVDVPEGHLWVMGDNRGQSSDSRVFGPIQRETVLGRAVMKVWPPSDASFL